MEPPRLTVIGCRAAAPAHYSAASGYLVTVGDTNILVDCGPGVAYALLQHLAFDALSAVIITHEHQDHMADIVALAYYRCFPQRLPPLPVYGPLGMGPTYRALDDVFKVA